MDQAHRLVCLPCLWILAPDGALFFFRKDFFEPARSPRIRDGLVYIFPPSFGIDVGQ